MNHKNAPLWRRLLPALVLAAAIVAVLFLGSRLLLTKVDAEALSLAERGVRRAAVECYALEGFYPDSLDYLTEHYGVTIDPNHYVVYYQFIASNLMPDVTVLAK